MRSARKMMLRSAVLMCGLGLATAGAAAAQEQTPPPPAQGQMQGGRGMGMMMDPSARSERMKKELNLSDDQTSKVKSILEDGHSKMEALRSNSSVTGEDRRSQMMAIRKTENEKIEALLTPEQKAKFEAMQKRMRGRMGGGGPPSGAQPQN